MPDAAREVDDLIHDAELVQAYAARAGLLSDDRLSQAISAAREAAPPAATAANSALAMTLSNAIKTISPVTLLDLREGRSPFDPASKKAATRLQSLLSVFTIALVAVIAFYMVSLQREQEALVQINKIEDSGLFDKLFALRRMAEHEGVFDNPDLKYDNYRQKLGEVRQLQVKMTNGYHVIYQAIQTPLVPFQAEFEAAWKWLEGFLFSPVNVSSPAVVTTSAATQVTNSDPCEGDPSKLVKPDSWLGKVALDALADFCFSSKTLSSDFVSLQSPSSEIAALKERVMVKSGWILPFLYGVLGACIYLMRSQLSTRTATITSIPAVLRIALGGVAGIVIGWFGATGNTSSVVAASSLPFALAFMAGFSIDVLFSLLDRFNRAITEQVKP